MKILFNCTTNNVGGGVKNSAIFIKYAIEDKNNIYSFAISIEVKDILNKWNIETSNMYLFEKSPARNKEERKRLYNLSLDLNVDLVFTMAGPAYVRFSQTHLIGISNPYITHTDFQGLSIGKNNLELIKAFLLVCYQAFYARKADYWLFQTNESRNGFIKRYKIKFNKTNVISNAIGNEFANHYLTKQVSTIDLEKTINIFCPAADYLHKGLHLIPNIAKELKIISKNDYKFKFILTISENSTLWNKINEESKSNFVDETIINIGPYNYTTVLNLFDNANIVFVPSILETFSASYLESFASKNPLIVADKGFARDICKEGALYVNPTDSVETANTIDNLIRDDNMQTRLINTGSKIIDNYGNQESRVNNIIKLFNIITKEK
jgi:glycosyltransferase involved in cell wall biosynthesis